MGDPHVRFYARPLRSASSLTWIADLDDDPLVTAYDD
jgi:hypothetical protein